MDKSIEDWTLRELMASPDAGRAVRQVWSWAREAGTITERDSEAAGFREFGAGSRIEFPQLLLQNTDWISLGPNTLIGPFAVLSVGMVEGQDGLDTGPRGSEPIITVGERCGFGRYFQLIAHLHVEIGDVTWFAPGCYVIDHHHRHDLSDVPVARPWPLDVTPVRIGAGTVISTGAVILPGAHIGENSMVASGAQVRAGTYSPLIRITRSATRTATAGWV